MYKPDLYTLVIFDLRRGSSIFDDEQQRRAKSGNKKPLHLLYTGCAKTALLTSIKNLNSKMFKRRVQENFIAVHIRLLTDRPAGSRTRVHF